MLLLPRKGVLAIAAVTDIAINGDRERVTAKSLTAHHRLPARHLEDVLQRLVREGILQGTRGPHGGYTLGREPRKITADDILRAIGALEDGTGPWERGSSVLLDKVVCPAIEEAENAFSKALSAITLDDLIRSAQTLRNGKRQR
jgi:Rrf2 family transcriptional regulator, iron-sulfur cluster assembly transcription factor